MKLIPYSIFIYINLVLSVILIILPWIVGSDATSSSKVIIALFGVVGLINLAISQNKPFKVLEITPKKIVVLVSFLVSIIVSFTPYLFSFTSVRNLVWVVLVTSGLSLASLIFTNLDEIESK